MGLFDIFGSREKREAKRIRDLAKRAQEKYGDSTARMRALEGLREIGTDEAILALLGRFTVRTEPQITDAEEKETTFQMVTSFGDKAVGPVREFLEKQDNISWALRCLEALVSKERFLETVMELLDKLSRQYVREPDKKVLLLHKLEGEEHAGIVQAALPYLEDPSDEVRIAALQVLTAQKVKDEESVGAIADCLVGAEAPRVRMAAAEALATLGQPVGADKRESVEAKLPEGFSLGKDAIIRRST